MLAAKMGSLVAGQEFQHILRLLNTNVDGKTKVMYALTAIKGIGRRFSNIVCKKAEVDMKKRAGEYHGGSRRSRWSKELDAWARIGTCKHACMLHALVCS